MTSSTKPFTRSAASLSHGVACRFTITKPFFGCRACRWATQVGISEAGVTMMELPKAKHKSVCSDSAHARFTTFSGKSSPNPTPECRRGPPHLPRSQLRPVNPPEQMVLNVRSNSHPQRVHLSTKMLPCSSLRALGGMPDFRCSPSTFCEMMCFNRPAFHRRKRTLWVRPGFARAHCSRMLPAGRSAFGNSHMPGPVGNTVFKPLRKSAIPAPVEMPAPVKAIMCLAFAIICAKRTHLASNSGGSSKNSTKRSPSYFDQQAEQ
mmetsp:Transcript_8982/g.27299  ORF Transcript_8982/g.27299 Transcript_8982/m.27299 type:complete len:263 (-) Transcript_8982:132-920(-)